MGYWYYYDDSIPAELIVAKFCNITTMLVNEESMRTSR